MGERTRAFDWSVTPVGAPSTWPQSLRTVVGLCFSSRYPISLFWGPHFIQFYNDAYRPVLGATKHPAALGQPVEPGELVDAVARWRVRPCGLDTA